MKNKDYSTFHNPNGNTINNTRFFNIGQADNFSILNSYETLLNTHQKFTNDFFAESNVSFKNSFLKNMKNKTSFRNMRILKNSFSQSSIHMNDVNLEVSKSNLNFYRNSVENVNLPKRISGLILKSNTNYNNYNNFNEKQFNNNKNDIFYINDEKDYEELLKNKTLNKIILNHLNKDSTPIKFSEKNVNKRRIRLDLNLEDPKGYFSKKFFSDSKSKVYVNQDEDGNQFINQNDLEKIAEGFEIFPTEKLTERSAEYKVVTEIIENIKLIPDSNTITNNYIINNNENNFICDDQENKIKKIRRLKEQQKLLNNCCNCNENNNKTIYENLLNEKEELNKEIEELIEFLKNERLLINKLSKKLNL